MTPNFLMKFLIFENGETHAYTFTAEKVKKVIKYTLFKSNSPLWMEHCRGEVCITVTDDGSKLKMKGVKNSVIEYYQIREMSIIFECIKIYEEKQMSVIREHYTITEENILSRV